MKPQLKTNEYLTVTCLLFGLVFLLSLLSGYARATTEATTTASTSDGSVSLGTGEEKLSYALGMILGIQLREQAVEIDTEVYHQGLKEALAGKPTQMTETEARSVVNRLEKELTRKQLTTRPAEIKPSGIEVAFKLDPRLTRSMYMGERWVTPPTFTIVQPGREAVVEARAHGVNSKGNSLKINPKWSSKNHDMVQITPGIGDQVQILVKSAGQTELDVEIPGVTKTYIVKAFYIEESIQVEISQ